MWSLSANPEEHYTTSASKTLIFTRNKIAKPKPKIQLPVFIERKKDSKTRYVTAGSKINEDNQRNIHSETSPFKYPDDLDEFSYKVLSKAWRDEAKKNEKKLKYNERKSYRTRQKRDVLNRLWVKESDVKSMKTILDMDEQFFSLVEGRPVPKKFNHKEYIQNMRDLLRTNITIGYKRDQIMLINEQNSVEQKTINRTKIEFQKHVDTFEKFLFADHTISMDILIQEVQERNKAQEQYELFKQSSKKYNLLKSTLYNLEEKWRKCKMYQKFLYFVSPMDWRKRYDYYYIPESEHSVELGEAMSSESIFNRYRLTHSKDALSLTNLIELFVEDTNLQEEPYLYFTDPTELVQVLEFIELQNLNSVMHSEALAAPIEQLKVEKVIVEKKFADTVTYLEDVIGSLEGGIIWEEERAVYLEQLALELINGDFKELISNDSVVNMYALVENVYQTSTVHSDANLTVSTMMKKIEATYLEYVLQLDRLPADIVRSGEMECYAEEAKTMKSAELAAKKLVQVERLLKHLSKLLQPPLRRNKRELKWRSAPKSKPIKPPASIRTLTEQECEHLTFFVDTCDHIDGPEDFAIRVHKVDNKHINEEKFSAIKL